MLDFFLWLDGSAMRYWTLAWTVFGLWFLSALLPAEPGTRWHRWNHPLVYAGLMLLMMAAFRWPGIGQNFELGNPDESQLLAGALTMLHDGQYWGRVDCGSAGPLNMLPLLLPKVFGQPLDYTGARCVGLLLLWGSAIFAWLTLRRVATERVSRLLIMPMACVLSFIHYGEFVQYTSEQAPVFFCGLAVWLTVTAFGPEGTVVSRHRLALAGGIASLLPFAKLQAAPFGVCLGLWALAAVFRQKINPWRTRLAEAGWLAGGALAALGLMGLAVLRGGAAADFYQTYLLTNFNYTQARNYPWSAAGERLGYLVDQVWGFDRYFIPALVLLALGLAAWGRLPPATRRLALLGGLLFITGLFVVVAPGREFEHYLQFLILPVSLLVGVLYAGLCAAVRPLGRALVISLVVLAGVGPQVYFRSHDQNPFLGYLQDGRANAVGPVTRQILAYRRPGDTLTVWGWMPAYHVQAQLPQATPDAHTERAISSNPQQAYFQRRAFAALAKNPPAVFVDAVGENNFGYHNRAANAHENFPWLRAFVADHYVLVADIETSRVYIRQDRWAEAHP
jgi:hypothetical protein